MTNPTKADSDEEEEKGAFDTGDLEGWIKVSGSRFCSLSICQLTRHGFW